MKHHFIRSPQVLNIFEIPNYRILPPLVLLQIPSPLRGERGVGVGPGTCPPRSPQGKGYQTTRGGGAGTCSLAQIYMYM